MNLEIGSTVGDYEIVGVLGAGGMGKVFKVRNTISNRVEAMKVLLPDLSGEPELADRFLREIQVLARLEHPNIAGLHTALRFENQLLMLMELVDGVALDARLRQGPLPVAEAVKCIDQILAALAYAHQHGVIHRDIKPANMILMPSGTVKLMDFGIAKGAADRKLTVTGGTIGSVYYMSPEQISGSENLDARSDLYSVGVSFYELVTGKRAFDGDSQFAIMAAHLEKTPAPPITIDPNLPQALNDLILLSVARDAGERFQTAEAFRNALKSVMETAAPVAPPPVAVGQIVPAAIAQKSHRAQWALVGALCCAAVLVGLIEFGPKKKAAAGGPVAPPQVAAPEQKLVLEQMPAAPTSLVEQPAPVEHPATEMPKPSPAKQEAARRVPAAGVKVAPALPMPRPIQQPVVQTPVPAPQPDLTAKRAELQKLRESMAMLSARSSGIHGTLQNLQRSQAGIGLGLRSDWAQWASLMDSYLRGSNDALAAGDTAAAKDFMEKGERQIERLEKALNR